MIKLCITGVTGGLGSRVLHHLIHTLRYPPTSLIVSLHNPAGLPVELQDAGLDIRHGDFTKPETLRKAFSGAQKLLIVSYPSIAHRVRVDAHQNAIDAAKAVGVEHLYYTSLAFAGDSKAAVMQAHIETEAYLKRSGLTYTILREGIYSESYPLYLGFFDAHQQAENNKDRRVVVPGDGGVAWVARDDLGEGTARIMLEEGRIYSNKIVLLSGAQITTLNQLAGMISNVLHWEPPLKVHLTANDEEYVDYHTEQKHGHKNNPDTRDFLQSWATTYPAMQKGELAVVDPLLQQLLGRELKPLKTSLVEALKDISNARENIEQYAK
ncbi:MAG: hypothetical protein M1827_004837 [Pycnora praestabilis]|nr:MAG: hypothetical protein M1827_004837 [Pycnora praestabilis]